MSDALYERYKDALRRGHVAALRGRLNAAIAAYSEAAEIAPERSLPHASLGRVLVRLERHDEALAAFGMALDRSADDEGALLGRADVLAATGRRVEAANTLDRLAGVQDAAGRLAEACDTARRALELAESRTRRRLVEELARRLRETPNDDAAAAALERAMSFLEPPTAPPEGPPPGADGTIGAEAGADAAAGHESDVEPEASEPPPDGATLVADGERLVATGDIAAAQEAFIAAAHAHRTAGLVDAALDACYLGLSLAPADPDLHLTLAELYLIRGWRAPAAEKLLLLGRLVELAGDQPASERLCAIVRAEFADDPRLTALCA